MTTLPPSCAVVMKSGNLNFLEPSGPLQSVTGLLYLLLINLHKHVPTISSTNIVQFVILTLSDTNSVNQLTAVLSSHTSILVNKVYVSMSGLHFGVLLA